MFNMSKEEKFNFDIANLKQDFAIENINITASDIEMLKRYSNQEISESEIIDIIKKANKKILIVDNYIDDSVLKMLVKKKNNVEVVILTSDKSNIENLDVKKFNKEYPVLKVAKTNKFHDRFIIIDNKEMYHLGASIKDLGKKCFAINRIEDMEIIEKIINL